jgi:hypothetical protein
MVIAFEPSVAGIVIRQMPLRLRVSENRVQSTLVVAPEAMVTNTDEIPASELLATGFCRTRLSGQPLFNVSAPTSASQTLNTG